MPFRDRLREAAKHAKVGYSQTAIARSLGLKRKQTVDRWMGDGQPSPELIYVIADKWGVDPRWLATGKGAMLPKEAQAITLAETRAKYDAGVSPEALEIARAFDKMQPQTKERIREHVFIYSIIDSSLPWLRSGRPVSEQYDTFERWHKENMQTAVTLEAARITKRK